jgi:hypothetical protein
MKMTICWIERQKIVESVHMALEHALAPAAHSESLFAPVHKIFQILGHTRFLGYSVLQLGASTAVILGAGYLIVKGISKAAQSTRNDIKAIFSW